MSSSFKRTAFTLVELLVVISIIGLLVGIAIPAVQSARESARRTQCQNNLRQIALGTELFHDSFKCYPPGRYQSRPGDPDNLRCGGDETTWLARILPYLEQSSIEEEWDYGLEYAAHEDRVREFRVPVYSCPTRRRPGNAVANGLLSAGAGTITLPCGCQVPVGGEGGATATGAVGDYGGNHGDLSPGAFGLSTDFYYGGNGTGIIISSRAKCDADTPITWVDRIRHGDVSDGLSNTILAGEMYVPNSKIGLSPGDSAIIRLGGTNGDPFIFNGDSFFNSMRVGGPTVPIIGRLNELGGNSMVSWGSSHVTVCYFAMADGSVRGISPSLDTEMLARIGNRHDHQIVELD